MVVDDIKSLNSPDGTTFEPVLEKSQLKNALILQGIGEIIQYQLANSNFAKPGNRILTHTARMARFMRTSPVRSKPKVSLFNL